MKQEEDESTTINKMDMGKYKEGETVYERIHPSQKLIITRYCNGIYYAQVAGHERRELVFLETEIKAIPTLAKPRAESKSNGLFSFQLAALFRLWKAVRLKFVTARIRWAD